ncbi:MAG: hypothetical protein MUF42_07300 [Cytophagaceae bacterium]|jgi:hypothetical protein|nr:hypothetical protein [Cytophagaceae bacterium]
MQQHCILINYSYLCAVKGFSRILTVALIGLVLFTQVLVHLWHDHEEHEHAEFTTAATVLAQEEEACILCKFDAFTLYLVPALLLLLFTVFQQQIPYTFSTEAIFFVPVFQQKSRGPPLLAIHP